MNTIRDFEIQMNKIVLPPIEYLKINLKTYEYLKKTREVYPQGNYVNHTTIVEDFIYNYNWSEFQLTGITFLDQIINTKYGEQFGLIDDIYLLVLDAENNVIVVQNEEHISKIVYYCASSFIAFLNCILKIKKTLTELFFCSNENEEKLIIDQACSEMSKISGREDSIIFYKYMFGI